MNVTVEWKGKMAFEATTPSGKAITMDSDPEDPDQGQGPSPMEALLAALGGCTAMDVISILEKKRQVVTGYQIEVSGVRPPSGEWPRPFTEITVRHILKGENIDPAAVERAVQLTDEKYCSVLATLRTNPAIKTAWSIE